jgi:hypothetical protein
MSAAASYLRLAKALIEDPSRWAIGAFARTESGRVIGAREAPACRWCATGALEKVGGTAALGGAFDHLFDAAKTLKFAHPALLNDHGLHSLVMRMFDLAIKFAEKP